ncbi:MAG: ABC transporter substrate-binding protein [Candidatus Neomarinimicrobiota bacterium]|nr:MAG: ABC transporter substrate-binding protein [Candidatus Neomarinimicrobiota bacterium]
MKIIHNVLVISLLFMSSMLLTHKTYIIKMSTVAPEGSSWMNEMHDFEKEIIELTNGQIKFRVYPNGVMGGEKDVLRKMRLGQIHSGAFTGVGLGEVVPEIRILDLPFLFRNSSEVDYVYNALFDEFQKKFTEKGFFLAGWAEVGFIYLFTKTPVSCMKDFSKVKMWLWKGDPLARTTFKVMNIPSIPLDVTDVHTSLQTGLINGVYISPYGVLALQWFTKANYMMDYPLTNSVGAVLITTKKINSIPKDLREILISKTKENMRKIVLQSRKENEESIKVLQESGITLTLVKDSKAMAEFDEAGRIIREKLVGKLYSHELLDKVLSLLKEYRSSHGS